MVVTVGYVGMTHLGLCSAAGALSRGASVICFDPNPQLISNIRGGKLPVNEPHLSDIFFGDGNDLIFTERAEDLVRCDIVYVAPDVATDETGASDLSQVSALLSLVDDNIGKKCPQIILSQVPPGFTRPLCRDDRELYYQVETLVFGRAVERATRPERFIVGCADPTVALPEAFQGFLEAFGCPILKMRYESAELAKIAINCFLVAQIGTTNTLAEICEGVGAHWSEIAPSLRLDDRIGTKAYLSPGLGIAGGNLERDLATVIALGEKLGTDTGIVVAEIENSKHRKLSAARILREMVLPLIKDPQVAVWGLAYKENTHSTKNSPSIATMSSFPELRFRTHDPVVSADAAGATNMRMFDDPLAAAKGADCLMILTPWNVYREIDSKEIVEAMRGKCIIDPYGVIDSAAAQSHGLTVVTLGAPIRG